MLGVIGSFWSPASKTCQQILDDGTCILCPLGTLFGSNAPCFGSNKENLTPPPASSVQAIGAPELTNEGIGVSSYDYNTTVQPLSDASVRATQQAIGAYVGTLPGDPGNDTSTSSFDWQNVLLFGFGGLALAVLFTGRKGKR